MGIKLIKIHEFRGSYDFLSNFYDSTITYEGLTYKNAEAAFQAQKDKARSSEFTTLPPNLAKRLGRNVRLRKDWDKVKDQIMFDIVKAKFEQNSELMEKLILTGDSYLEEGNTWNDRYWGVCNGVGKNKLGEILMQVRKRL